MTTAREQAAWDRLETLLDSRLGLTWRASKQIKRVAEVGGQLEVDVELGYAAASQHAAIREELQSALGAAVVQVTQRVVAHSVRGQTLFPGVKNLIAVGSGKGGVGKSTVSANLALALQAEGARVGLLDADIYGPSVPKMLGASGRPESTDGKTMAPLLQHGLQVMSIGFLVEEDAAMIWRGPMATGALDQLARQTRWDDLDYLIVDLPPGTGDIQLTLAQRMPLTAAVIVSTPQDMALIDAQKAMRMFEKVSVPMLGLVENMAVYCCPNCGHTDAIFGEDGGKALAARFGVPLLAELPLLRRVRELSDAGTPPVLAEPDSEVAQRYRALAHQVGAALARLPKDFSGKIPKMVPA